MLLGVNIDHVATLRAVRGVAYPDLAAAVRAAEAGGADFITAHLREDRRHIRDDDVDVIMKAASTWLNLEIAASHEMIAFAAVKRPRAVCIVPEKREELTTEGGLDAHAGAARLAPAVAALTEAGIEVSLFIEPDEAQLQAAAKIGAAAIELHTGRYANLAAEHGLQDAQTVSELERLRKAAAAGRKLGLKVNAGHGLTRDNVGPIAAMDGLAELNIGHSIVADAVFMGLESAVAAMRKEMKL